MEAVRTLYAGAHLVHGDLSEYNILVVPAHLVENMDPEIQDPSTDLQAVLIDFGQAVDPRHQDSRALLERDLDRVSSFFARQGIATMPLDQAVRFVVELEHYEF